MRLISTILLSIFSMAANAQFFEKIDPVTGHVTLVNFDNDNRADENQATEKREKKKSLDLPIVNKKDSSPPKNRDFPVVTASEQKNRDIDRRGILNEELAKEKNLLVDRTARKADDATIARIKSNIASLEREISAVR